MGGQFTLESGGQFDRFFHESFLVQLSNMGKSAGIEFQHKTTLVANTFSAHKVLHLAKEYKKSSEMEVALFDAHFINGMNVADIDVLISLAEALGIPKEEALQVLSTDKYDYEIKLDIMEARNIGATGVPFFLFNNKYAISGAQPVESFVEVMTKAHQQNAIIVNETSNDQNSCGIGGCSI